MRLCSRPDGNRRAPGDGSIQHADAVVSNGDLAWTYRYLIPAAARRQFRDRRIDRLRYSLSLFVIYFGTKRRYAETGLAHHNIIFSQRYQGLFNDIFNKKVFGDEFSLTCMCLLSPTQHALHPAAKPSTWSHRCQTWTRHVDWNKAARPYRDR